MLPGVRVVEATDENAAARDELKEARPRSAEARMDEGDALKQ